MFLFDALTASINQATPIPSPEASPAACIKTQLGSSNPEDLSVMIEQGGNSGDGGHKPATGSLFTGFAQPQLATSMVF